MHRLFRLTAAVITGCALLAAAAAGWAYSGGLGQDLADLPALVRQISEGEQRHEELERQGRAVARRLAAKQAVVEELVAGRLSLSEAAERFRALNAEDPAVAGAARVTFPGASDEEVARRQVLAWARGLLEDCPPEVRDEVLARLEREALGTR